MWVYFSDAMFSVVSSPGDTNTLVVRARAKADLQHYFPHEVIQTHGGTDYAYRIKVSKALFGHVLIDYLMSIDYTNFKNTVKGRVRAKWYTVTWQDAVTAQRLMADLTLPEHAIDPKDHGWTH